MARPGRSALFAVAVSLLGVVPTGGLGQVSATGPVVGSEFAIGPDFVTGGIGPQVAFDGANYLVVWADARDGVNYRIYAARVSASGEVLDPNGIEVSATGAAVPWSEGPTVAFDGTNYLVAWADTRGSIYATRVSTGGVVLDGDGFVVIAGCGQFAGLGRSGAALAFGGTNYLAVCTDGKKLYGSRVSTEGTVIDSPSIVIDSDEVLPPSPNCSAFFYYFGRAAVAFDGANFFVVYENYNKCEPGYAISNVYGARISEAAGGLLDKTPIPISTTLGQQWRPAVAFGSGVYLVAWLSMVKTENLFELHGVRVTGDGVVLDPDGFVISSALKAWYMAASDLPAIWDSPSIVFDNEKFLVSWNDRRRATSPLQNYNDYPWDIYSQRVMPDADVAWSSDQLLASDVYDDSVVGGRATATNGQGASLLVYAAARTPYDGLPIVPQGVRARLVTTWATVSVAKSGNGTGRVTSAPSGIDCGPTCSAQFDASTAVTLTATADPGSQFVGWSGDCTGAGSCSVTVDASKSTMAKFVVPPVLSAVRAGAGPVAGGATVLLTGNNLQAGATVTFGGVSATNVSVITTTANGVTVMKCTAPPHAAGAVDVSVANPDGGSATRTRAYYYVPPPH